MMMRPAGLRRPVLAVTVMALLLVSGAGPKTLQAQAQPRVGQPAGRQPTSTAKLAQLNEADVRTWLTYLSSDLMQGRAVFTEGYGLASSYIAGELRAMGIKPMGDHGTYLQAMSRTTYRTNRQSSMTVVVNGESRTFVQGDHVSFPLEAGGKQRLTFKGIEFAGAGPGGDSSHLSRLGRDVSGRLVLYMPPARTGGRGRGRGTADIRDRSSHLVNIEGAAAVIARVDDTAIAAGSRAQGPGRGAGPGAGRGTGTSAPPAAPGPGTAGPPAPGPAPAAPTPAPTFVTVVPVDAPRAPALTGDGTLFGFLLRNAPTPFEELDAKASRGEALPTFRLDDVTVTIEINNTYEVVEAEYTQNVVAMVEGSDPALRNTYVFFGAHLDHVGYSSGTETQGRVNTPLDQDRIWNGADDDGSGSVALLALAKAFQNGPRPRRSVVFVWHAGEEDGMLGSAFMAARPVVPIESIQAQLNIDMIGRNRDNDPAQANTVYLIGADRISTDLHNLLVTVNAAQTAPLTLDYEFNDPSDPNQFYTRSDHHSYAVKGIPVAFFFTGTHPDYHANTDTVDKIIFPKLVRIAQYVYEAGFSIANSERTLVRDNRGPRSGRGFSGPLQ